MTEIPNYLVISHGDTGLIQEIKLGRMLNWVREHNCGKRDIVSNDDMLKCTIGFLCNGCGESKNVPLFKLKFEMQFVSKAKEILMSNDARVKFASDCNADIEGLFRKICIQY